MHQLTQATNPYVHTISRQDWIADELTDLAAQTIDQISTIDANLLDLARLLDSAQPQKPGKIGLRFWRDKSRPAGKIPYLFVWEKRIGGDWHAKHLSAKYVSERNRKKGDFLPTAREVTILLRLISQLMTIRQGLLGSVGILRRAVKQRLVKANLKIEAMLLDMMAFRLELEAHPHVAALEKKRKHRNGDVDTV